jgi:hypothetical protein
MHDNQRSVYVAAYLDAYSTQAYADRTPK